jgi:hypothetical protein
MFGGSAGDRVAGGEDGMPTSSSRRRKKNRVDKPRPVMYEVWLDVRQWTSGEDVYPEDIEKKPSTLESLLVSLLLQDGIGCQ